MVLDSPVDVLELGVAGGEEDDEAHERGRGLVHLQVEQRLHQRRELLLVPRVARPRALEYLDRKDTIINSK